MTITLRGDNGHIYQQTFAGFADLRAHMARDLLDTEPFNAGSWQQLDISGSDAHDTYELRNVTLWIDLDEYPHEQFRPDMPWARDHFHERVGGLPVNPGSTHEYWPYHGNGAGLHLRGKIYDHNYMERIWPKEAGWDCGRSVIPHFGIRFEYGDLADVVALLKREPLTRQAFLPIWFPEDTGAAQGQRVPCSLGYHFMFREGRLDCTYYLRSCEVYRHFTNDMYLAGMLTKWVRDQAGLPADLGQLTVHISSFHGFVGDRPKIEELACL